MTKLPSRCILLIYIPPSPSLGEYDFCQSNKEYKLSCLGLHLFDLQNIQHYFCSENHLFMIFAHVLFMIFQAENFFIVNIAKSIYFLLSFATTSFILRKKFPYSKGDKYMPIFIVFKNCFISPHLIHLRMGILF